MRLFAAIVLPDALSDALAGYLDAARRVMPDRALRWVPPQHLHVTLAFLGDVERAALPAVVAALNAAASATAPLTLSLSGSGRFASAVWIGVGGDVAALGALARRLADGLALDPAFHPHVTIGRYRDRAQSRRLAVPPFVGSLPFEASELVLLQSVPQPVGPPDYVAVHRAPFTSTGPLASGP